MPLKELLRAAKSLIGNNAASASRAVASPASFTSVDSEYPLEIEDNLNRLHSRAPIEQHLHLLFDADDIGGESFTDLYRRCLTETGTPVTPFNVFHRFQSRRDLLRYFLGTLTVPGARAECGVYRGATALLLARAWRSRDPNFAGDGLYLIDSFVGTSASGEHDLIAVRAADGSVHREAFFPVAQADISADLVRGFFAEFPQTRVCAGWIPEVFKSIEERNWAYVHLDVTLYEPTLAALDYFYPRLSTGGIIVCDGSIFCPGARKAWDDYCAINNLAFVTLGNRETVLIKS